MSPIARLLVPQCCTLVVVSSARVWDMIVYRIASTRLEFHLVNDFLDPSCHDNVIMFWVHWLIFRISGLAWLSVWRDILCVCGLLELLLWITAHLERFWAWTASQFCLIDIWCASPLPGNCYGSCNSLLVSTWCHCWRLHELSPRVFLCVVGSCVLQPLGYSHHESVRPCQSDPSVLTVSSQPGEDSKTLFHE